MALIGISGKIGSGKDTIGKIIQYLVQQTKIKPEITLEEVMRNGLTKELEMYSGWKIKKYGYKLKQIASLLTGIPVEEMEKEEVKNKLLGSKWSWYGSDPSAEVGHVTLRWMLQRLGTEAIRNNIHKNAWINALFVDYEFDNYTIAPNWIITDVRFPNEVEAIKERGGIMIRVNRLTKEDFNDIANGRDSHPSETSLDNHNFDYIIYNSGTIEELVEKVKGILIKEKVI